MRRGSRELLSGLMKLTRATERLANAVEALNQNNGDDKQEQSKSIAEAK